MKPSILFSLILLGALCTRTSNAQEGTSEESVEYSGIKFLSVHWVLSVTDRGKSVRLEDGSIWQVCPYCTQTASRVLPGSLVAIEDRGSTRKYPYRILVSANGQESYPINAACIVDGTVEGQLLPPVQAARAY
jgi:hypothetical protein